MRRTILPPMAHMGDQLELLLRDRGWRQADLARRLGWSRQRVSQKFGVDKWTTETVWAIAQVTGVPTDFFFVPAFPLPSKEHMK